jgi:hypothetical protein
MHCRMLVIFIFVFVMVPSLSFATKVENLFSNPYHHLLEEVLLLLSSLQLFL